MRAESNHSISFVMHTGRRAVCLSACLLLLGLSACGQGNKTDSVVKRTGVDGTQAGVERLTEVEQTDPLSSETQSDIAIPPASGKAKQDSFAAFSTVDLEGRAVDAGLLSGNRLTVINIWGTFCPPCLKELPTLGQLSKEYADQGVGFAGIVVDALLSEDSYDKGQIEVARQIVKQTDLSYPQLLPSPDLNTICLADTQSIPVTLFVDSSGQILDRHLGAIDEAGWRKLIDRNLEDLGK